MWLAMNPEGTVVVASTWKLSEASVIRSLLESYSIPCGFSSRIPRDLYLVFLEGLAEIQVFVPATLEAYARRILEEHRRPDSGLRLVEPDDAGIERS